MKRGFTIVELLLYMGLMSILLLVLTQIFTGVLDVQSESAASSSVEQDGRYILARLHYDIATSKSIISPLLGQASSAAQLSIGGSTVTYDGGGASLLITAGGNTDNLNSYGTKISKVSFLRLGLPGGNDTLQVSFTLTSTTNRPAGPAVQTFLTTIGQRCNGLNC